MIEAFIKWSIRLYFVHDATMREQSWGLGLMAMMIPIYIYIVGRETFEYYQAKKVN